MMLDQGMGDSAAPPQVAEAEAVVAVNQHTALVFRLGHLENAKFVQIIRDSSRFVL